jgi:hypothetical protein
MSKSSWQPSEDRPLDHGADHAGLALTNVTYRDDVTTIVRTARFDVAGKSFAVERAWRSWTLEFEGRVVETRDLTEGIDELLGKTRQNLGLAISILEWEAVAPTRTRRS